MIRIRRCTCPTCGRNPRRFWFVHLPAETITTTSFAQAVQVADAHTKGAPS